MKLKRLLGLAMAHHMMRHRQHRRFMRNVTMPIRELGRTKAMLLLGAVALAGRLFKRR